MTGTDDCQSAFAQRWAGLTRPHVRALAWLLDAPNLLDAAAPDWQGRIAARTPPSPAVAAWLAALERDPVALDAALGPRPYTRLGLYAEKLMAFYFRAQGRLVAHSLQVRPSHDDTVGEFDFLLEAEDGLEHLEFATKFYLLAGEPARDGYDSLVGPNLADSLGAKLRKILDRQLSLGSHPAAQALLTRPIVRAQALVKGWLFYPLGQAVPAMAGIAPDHCRGWWCACADLDRLAGAAFVVLPRLQWLAPYRGDAAAALDRAGLRASLATHFAANAMPVLVAAVRRDGEVVVETERGFVVPDDWRARAEARRPA